MDFKFLIISEAFPRPPSYLTCCGRKRDVSRQTGFSNEVHCLWFPLVTLLRVLWRRGGLGWGYGGRHKKALLPYFQPKEVLHCKV